MKKRYYILLIFLVPLTLTLSPVGRGIDEEVYADMFRLKNGEVIEGELISEDSKGIVIKLKYGTIRIGKSELISQEVKPIKETVKPVKIFKSSFTRTELTSSENLAGMKRWLESQTDPKTGLLESYRPTADFYLDKQASTYDQALAGLSFLALGDIKKARAILDFYKSKWNGNGFSNFYFTTTGNPGIETTAHLGPNLWIALLALHYDRVVSKSQYMKLAEDIVKWAMSLPHYRGGVAMSNQDEWRAQWTKVVSTENNIDYYAVLNILEDRTKDQRFKERIQQEKFGVIDFLQKTVYDKKNGSLYRGFRMGIVDREYALDTLTWLIAAVGIEELRVWRIDTEKLIAFAEGKFLVSDSGIKGFDFTDKKGAFKAKRPRMISTEWTLAMVNVYYKYKTYYSRLAGEQEDIGNNKKADELYKRAYICGHKMVYYLKQMDKTLLKQGPEENLYAFPYATRSHWIVFYDSPWWKTPKAGPDGAPCGSVASTAWRIFAERFNPLSSDGKLE